jgi:ATP-binding cassette, subfamily C, bacterial PrsD
LDRDLLARFIERYRKQLLLVLGASVLFNILVFAGTTYLILVYDSVLPSHSVPTLAGLFLILVLLYVFQYIFDVIRSDALLGIANGVHADLAPAVNHAAISRPLRAGPGEGDGQQWLRDLDQIHGFLSSPGPAAIFDLPWVIVFLLILTALHWWLGVAALVGVIVLAAIAITSSRKSEDGTRELIRISNLRASARQAQLRFGETAIAMGMDKRLRSHAAAWDDRYIETQAGIGRIVARYGGAGKVFRLLLQSIIITVGALLVIDGKSTGGIIIAASVLAGRALAPVDQAIANWRGFSTARAGWRRLVEAIDAYRMPAPRTVSLAAPSGELALRDVWVIPPGSTRPAVAGVTLTLEPGQALAIIGPSAAGKTSLIKAMLGIWPPARGEIRLDGATFAQWDAEVLGASFGYVPQAVELAEGTIGQNIARFDPEATSEAVIEAARAAAMHETILAFPDGYETHLSMGGNELSAGQRQRIGLARALYGNPHFVVLDEANSNLDAAGDEALAAAITAIRQRCGIAVMVTHRPATLGPLSHVAVMANGKLTDFGERDAVLQRNLRKPPPVTEVSINPAKAAGL